MEELQIRPATIEDKQDVLDINDNVYDGLDYLKDLYEDEFIRSSNTKSYVAVFNGKIVGFSAATVVDDGQTVISRAGRINQQYSSKGFYKMLKNHASNKSGSSIDAFTTGDSNPAINTSSFQQHNKLISTRTFFRFDFGKGIPRLSSVSHNKPIKLNPLTQDLLQEYFISKHYRKYLFPAERIILNWLPYRVLPTNIPLFWTRNSHCHRVTDLRNDDGKVKGLVSILTTLTGVSGVLVCSLDVFGTDIDSLKDHLTSHFLFLSKHSETDKSLLLMFDPQLGNECVEKVCDEFGLTKLLWNSFDSPEYFTAQCLFERSLSTDA